MSSRPPPQSQSGPALLTMKGLKMPSTNEKKVPTNTPSATKKPPQEKALLVAGHYIGVSRFRRCLEFTTGGARNMFETTIAGSLPKPAWLAETQKLWPAWRASGAELERAKRDATLLWLKEQEDAGLDVVTDGEQSRQHFVHGFLEGGEGIDFEHKVKMGNRAHTS